MEQEYIIVGKFDASKYNLNLIATTNDVILTKNRFYHIAENHPETLKYVKKIKKVLDNPDMIYKETKLVDTVWIVKKFENNVKITIRLNTVKYGKKNYKHSIIQMQFLEGKRIERYLNSNRVLKVFEKEKVI